MPYSLRVCIFSSVATLFTDNSFVTLLIRGLTAQVLVEWKDSLFLIVSGGDEVTLFLEDLLHGLIAAGSFSGRHSSRPVEAIDRVFLREIDDADAATVGLVRIGSAFQDRRYEGLRVDTDIAGPGDDALGRPVEIEAMVRGAVLGRRRVSGNENPFVECDALIIVIDLDGPDGVGDGDLFVRIGIRNRVKTSVFPEFYMIVDPDGRWLEGDIFILNRGQAL